MLQSWDHSKLCRVAVAFNNKLFRVGVLSVVVRPPSTCRDYDRVLPALPQMLQSSKVDGNKQEPEKVKR